MQLPPTWSVVQVTYTEIVISSLGSFSYAEDDSRHIVGIKTTQQTTTAASTLSTAESTTQQEAEVKYCCHVLECENEVSSLFLLNAMCVTMSTLEGNGSADLFSGQRTLPWVHVATGSKAAATDAGTTATGQSKNAETTLQA